MPPLKTRIEVFISQRKMTQTEHGHRPPRHIIDTLLSILCPVLLVIGALFFAYFASMTKDIAGILWLLACIYLLMAYGVFRLASRQKRLVSSLLTLALLVFLSATAPTVVFLASYDYLTNQATDPAPEQLQEYTDPYKVFDWTVADVKTLAIGKTSLEEVVARKGKANEVTDHHGYYHLSYKSSGASQDYVTLSFEDKGDGQIILNHVYASLQELPLPSIKEREQMTSWTRDDYDRLIEGAVDTGQGGSLWSEIQQKGYRPFMVTHSLSNHRHNLSVTYAGVNGGDDSIRGLNLYFYPTEDGLDFQLYKKEIIE